jgi:hypothetical protein
MPGNSQPMQCLPGFKLLMRSAAGLEAFAQRAAIKTEKGLACLLSADTGTDLCR